MFTLYLKNRSVGGINKSPHFRLDSSPVQLHHKRTSKSQSVGPKSHARKRKGGQVKGAERLEWGVITWTRRWAELLRELTLGQRPGTREGVRPGVLGSTQGVSVFTVLPGVVASSRSGCTAQDSLWGHHGCPRVAVLSSPHLSSISISWELHRNADSQALPRLTKPALQVMCRAPSETAAGEEGMVYAKA